MEPDHRALLFLLIAQWAACSPDRASHDDDPAPWWLTPRQITAIAGQFDAPNRSDNDPTCFLVQVMLILVCLCAKTRAKTAIPRSINSKTPISRETHETRTIRDFKAFFGFFFLCQIEHFPT